MSLVLIDIAIALTVVFLMLCVFCSAVVEWIAQHRGARGRFLQRGLLRLIGDDSLYRQLVNHPLIENLSSGRGGHGPSYIPPNVFAEALLDCVLDLGEALRAKPGEASDESWRFRPVKVEQVQACLELLRARGFALGIKLAPLLRKSDGDMEKLRAAVADWYSAQTDRVIGWYKGYARTRLFLIGLLVALVFNVDTIRIASEAADKPGLRAALIGVGNDPSFVKAAAEAAARAAVGQKAAVPGGRSATGDPEAANADAETTVREVEKFAAGTYAAGLPIGYCRREQATTFDVQVSPGSGIGCAIEWWRAAPSDPGNLLRKILGWLLTALGVSLGAPFWFDLLNKLVNLRGAGPRPEDRPSPPKAKDPAEPPG